MRIVIVEDEIIIANDIKIIVERQGFEVAGIATECSQASELIKSFWPDIVLCDINLGQNKSGIQLMKELSGQQNFQIVFITAYSDEETIIEASGLNPVSFLVKPFNERQLIASVKLAALSASKIEDVHKPTQRELEIIKLISKGLNTRQIAEQLYISALTAKTHRRNLLAKYKLKNSAELILMAMNQKWIS
ncbi:MAG: DNA-binding response regulator [Bacteroidales bacterium]|nr:DNA-binding response regulator [Bacteroidales bacterium]